MSRKEVDRAGVIRLVVEKQLQQKEAAGQLGLSVRQIKCAIRDRPRFPRTSPRQTTPAAARPCLGCISPDAIRDRLQSYSVISGNRGLSPMVCVPYGLVVCPLWSAYTHAVYTDDQIEDLIIQRYEAQDPPSMLGGWREQDFVNPHPTTLGQGVERIGAAAAVVAGAGAAAGSATLAAASGTALNIANAFSGFYTTMFVIKSAAPMLQAVLLMMIYMLLLIYLVVSEYDVDAVITVLFLILAVRFFTPLWAAADYLDSQLFVAMFPDATFIGSVFTMGMERLLLDMVLTVLYVVAPALLLAMMTMAGQRIAKVGGADMSSKIDRVSDKVGGGGRKS